MWSHALRGGLAIAGQDGSLILLPNFVLLFESNAGVHNSCLTFCDSPSRNVDAPGFALRIWLLIYRSCSGSPTYLFFQNNWVRIYSIYILTWQPTPPTSLNLKKTHSSRLPPELKCPICRSKKWQIRYFRYEELILFFILLTRITDELIVRGGGGINMLNAHITNNWNKAQSFVKKRWFGKSPTQNLRRWHNVMYGQVANPHADNCYMPRSQWKQ